MADQGPDTEAEGAATATAEVAVDPEVWIEFRFSDMSEYYRFALFRH